MTKSFNDDFIIGFQENPNAKPRIEDVYGKLELEAVLAIEKIISLEQEFPGLVQHELLDHLDILADSARKGKYPMNNWLEPDGKKCSRKDNLASVARHWAEESCGIDVDPESGRAPALHGAVRLMMGYTRKKRGIKHSEDK